VLERSRQQRATVVAVVVAAVVAVVVGAEVGVAGFAGTVVDSWQA